MNNASTLKQAFVDLAAILFVIGGVVSLVMNLLTIPIANLYPITLPTSFSTVFIAFFAIILICSLGAIHCYSLTTKRLLSEAGIRGIIFGSLLLIFSLEITGNFTESTTSTWMTTLSATLIILGGVVCFGLRHTNVSASGIAYQQRMITQRSNPSQTLQEK
jgi:hypothetical protein